MDNRKAIILICIACLFLAISNIIKDVSIHRQDNEIKSIEKKIEEIRAENVENVNEVESLKEQLNKLEEEITGIKEQTDKIAGELVEVETREKAEEELKAATEETTEIEEVTTEYVPEKTITTEAPTTEEVTEEITTQTAIINEEKSEEVVEETTEGTSVDIPWVVYEVVECEVHGGDKESKMHVAHVIRNRVESGLFEDDYYSVCTSPYQFCRRNDVEQSTIDAVNEAMQIADTTGGALFFHSMEWMSSWGGYDYIFTDNVGHHFYG